MNKSNYCTFYIVRHGESEWNAARIMQGQATNINPLTNLGETQAQSIGKKLSSIHFDKVFSSDLLRAKQTAEIISLDRKLAILTATALRERTFGHMEGKTYEEFYQKFEKIIAQKETLAHRQRKSIKYAPDIESDDEVITRLTTFLREVAVAQAGKTVLIVSHGGPIRLLLQHLGWSGGKKLQPGFVPNTGYIKLRGDGIDFFVDEVVTSI